MLSYILAFSCSVLVLICDQVSKYLISQNLAYNVAEDFIKGFLSIQYIHNTGGAWGILSGKTWILLSVTVIAMVVLITLLIKVGLKSKLLFWAVSLIVSGGIGNLIDRAFRGGRVVDFLKFEFWPDFPIFNVADIAVCTGAGLLILYFIIDMIKEGKPSKVKEQDNGTS